MKNIAFLVSGNIRIYEKNLIFLKSLEDELKDFNFFFICSVWENQDTLEEFSKKYNVKFINQIKENNWKNKIEKIKFVTGGENLSFKIENIFHMWHSITENIKFLDEIVKKNEFKIDYVCRFRTDIMNINKIENLKNDIQLLKESEFLFSSNRHYRGVTDLFFIAKFETFLKLKDIFLYFDDYIKANRVFDPEYFFYCFINENNFKIKIAYKLDMGIVRIEESKPTKKVYIPLRDKINMKIARRKIKFIKIINNLKYFLK